MRINLTLDMDEAFVVNEALAAYREAQTVKRLQATVNDQRGAFELADARGRAAMVVQARMVRKTTDRTNELRTALGMAR